MQRVIKGSTRSINQGTPTEESQQTMSSIVARHGSWIGRHACRLDTRVRGSDTPFYIKTRHYITL
jgi:hypothetical protein